MLLSIIENQVVSSIKKSVPIMGLKSNPHKNLYALALPFLLVINSVQIS